MLPKIVTVDKTFQQRQHEYTSLYSESMLCSKMHLFWAEELKLVIGSLQWQALWLLSEESCIKFKVLYPATVVVKVNEMYFEELSAAVIVEEVQEDIDFPGICLVPIFELFPLKEQRVSTSVVARIADWFDRCRYFFLNLWYPWDAGENVTIAEWAENHLENRLILQRDILNGVLDNATANHIRSLIAEAVILEDAIENCEDGDMGDGRKSNLIGNVFRKENIKLELNFFESPDTREAMITRFREENNVNCGDAISLILPESSLAELAEYVGLCTSMAHRKSVRTYSNADSALKLTYTGCTVYFPPGAHLLQGLGNLSYGGELKGLSSSDNAVLTPKALTPPRFIFLKNLGPLLMNQLTIQRNEGVLISASNNLRLINCRLRGNAIVNGIIVQSGCCVEMSGCLIEGLGIGVILKPEAKAVIRNCDFRNCKEGIKIIGKATLSLSQGSITLSSRAAIILESDEIEQNVSGEINILTDGKLCPTLISVSGTLFSENKVDALIDTTPYMKSESPMEL